MLLKFVSFSIAIYIYSDVTSFTALGKTNFENFLLHCQRFIQQFHRKKTISKIKLDFSKGRNTRYVTMYTSTTIGELYFTL